MKLKKLRVFSIFIVFCLAVQNSTAQAYTITTTNFTINSGYTLPNLIGLEFSSQGNGSNGNNLNPIFLELGYNYSDRGLISFYFSDASASTGNFTWLDTSYIPHNYHYSVSIVTFGVSSRYYLTRGGNLRPYIGAMVGYYFINLVTNDELPAYGSVPISHSKASAAYRVYGGVAYYLNTWLGLDASAGYGNSYYVSLGLSFKFHISQKTYSR